MHRIHVLVLGLVLILAGATRTVSTRATELNTSTTQHIAQATWIDANGDSTFVFVFGTITTTQANGRPGLPTEGGFFFVTGPGGLFATTALTPGAFQTSVTAGTLTSASLDVIGVPTNQGTSVDIHLIWSVSGDVQLENGHDILRSPALGFVTNTNTRGVASGAGVTGTVLNGSRDLTNGTSATVGFIETRVQQLLQLLR